MKNISSQYHFLSIKYMTACVSILFLYIMEVVDVQRQVAKQCDIVWSKKAGTKSILALLTIGKWLASMNILDRSPIIALPLTYYSFFFFYSFYSDNDKSQSHVLLTVVCCTITKVGARACAHMYIIYTHARNVRACRSLLLNEKI